MQQDHHNPPQVSAARRQRDGGYLLLAIMLMMAFMVITATYYVAPRVVQQIKRDREEEMIHRGTEYARAIKKFYKKNGRYPATLDDLDKGQVRYLRKRFKDPLTKDGKWKLLNYADIATLLNAAGPGTPAAALGSQAGTLTPGGALIQGVPSSGQGSSFGSTFSQQQQSQQPGLTTGFSVNSGQGYSPQTTPSNIVGFPTNSDQGNNSEGVSSSDSGSNGQSGSNQSFGLGNNQQSGLGGSQAGGANQQANSPFGQNTTGGNTQFGGGAIVGVASLSKDPTIRIYNKKKTYNEWQFIYNPMMDQTKVLLRGPYQPTTISGAQIGTPAGQLNGQQGAFGQQQNGLGQQNGFGQQSNTPQQSQPQQPMQPGSNFPPEQTQPQ